eukprot:GGOE01018178.1.p3 GENE.GGOE01018178.1~~GGOE01018178.1.p3  ORF type:complete len:272 (+),score=60.41 GGOE01018178.1:97-912(+)
MDSSAEGDGSGGTCAMQPRHHSQQTASEEMSLGDEEGEEGPQRKRQRRVETDGTADCCQADLRGGGAAHEVLALDSGKVRQGETATSCNDGELLDDSNTAGSFAEPPAAGGPRVATSAADTPVQVLQPRPRVPPPALEREEPEAEGEESLSDEGGPQEEDEEEEEETEEDQHFVVDADSEAEVEGEEAKEDESEESSDSATAADLGDFIDDSPLDADPLPMHRLVPRKRRPPPPKASPPLAPRQLQARSKKRGCAQSSATAGPSGPSSTGP